MATVSIPLGTSARLWVASDPAGVALANPPYWRERLTPEEARRLAEALLAAAEAWQERPLGAPGRLEDGGHSPGG